MPTDADPATTRIHYDRIIHIQGYNCRSTDSRQTHDQRPRVIPLKVIGPYLLPRVKQDDRVPSQRILCLGRAPFELVTAAASKTQVLNNCFTAFGLRDNVIDRHRLPSISFGRLAISTAAIVSLKQAVTQVGGQVAHRLQFVCRRNLVSSPLEQRRSMDFEQHLPVQFSAKLHQFLLLISRENLVGVSVE